MSEKKHVNVGTIGHVDHGKTTLCDAIIHQPLSFTFSERGPKVVTKPRPRAKPNGRPRTHRYARGR